LQGKGTAGGKTKGRKVFARLSRERGGEIPILDIANRASYHRESLTDPELCEYFVPIRWLQTVPLENAVRAIGLFGNQNTVCKPTTPKMAF
jgi:hypothetical protein